MVRRPARKTSLLTQLDTKIPSSVTKISKKPEFWQRKTQIYLHVFIKIKIYVKLIMVIDLQSLNWVSLQKRQLPKIFWFHSSHCRKKYRDQYQWVVEQDELPTIFEKLSTFSGNFWTGLIIISDNRLMAGLPSRGEPLLWDPESEREREMEAKTEM